MKKWYGGILFASLFGLLVLSYEGMRSTIQQSYRAAPLIINATNPLKWVYSGSSSAVPSTGNVSQVISTDVIVSDFFVWGNFSLDELQSLQTLKHLTHLVDHAQSLPNAVESVKEAGALWKSLMALVKEDKLLSGKESSSQNVEQPKCPSFLNIINIEFNTTGYKIHIPCGLTHGSSVTIVGIPNGILGNFRIDLIGETLAGDSGEPPIILHYNVRLHGDKLTEDPVIVQNTWTSKHDWGEEERCPSPHHNKNNTVDELDRCNKMIGTEGIQDGRQSNSSKLSFTAQKPHKSRKLFPFEQGHLFVATLRVGEEGIQMSVNGEHTTSFAHREGLEPWLVNEAKISGDLNLISITANGLPTSENADIINLEELKSHPLPSRQPLDLFIGVFSTANNFKRRMAVRKTWMQYADVKTGIAAVRFFVGLHKNHLVNEELWLEARMYGDIQLMPFVDYYSVITWKALAICIFGTEVASAKYIMKTDDDAFVRVDELLASLNRINTNNGLLFGLINSKSHPHRNPDSKWYVKPQEWSEDAYPPWAHGPGYVVSSDIAHAVFAKYKRGKLKMFKLEDVAMGIWIDEMKKAGLDVKYVTEKRVYNVGCEDGFVVAHYQSPREMLCLWQNLLDGRAKCCSNRR